MITLGTDVSDLILQRTLYDNTLGLNSAIERMTSGYKINHASDNAAGYSMVTDLNKRISSMLQVQQNTEDGISLLQIAEGGLEEIESLLQRLRDLAVQASNGSYDADSRAAMQSEADSIIAEIERIKNSIEYDGMNLYETPRNEDSGAGVNTIGVNSGTNSISVNSTNSVSDAVSRLASSAKVSTDTNNSDTTFTQVSGLNTGGGTSSLSSVSLLSSTPSLMSVNSVPDVSTYSTGTIEGAEDFAANETKTVTIDGVEYTIKNRQTTVASSLSYIKDTSTGEITFYGNNFEIRGQDDVAHNVMI